MRVVGMLTLLGAVVPLCAAHAQLTTYTNEFLAPFDAFGSPFTVTRGAADATASRNINSGGIGIYTCGYVGGASAKAFQYITVTVSNPSRVTVEVDMTFVDAVTTIGPAALGGTAFLWTTDFGPRGEQDLTPAFSTARAITILADIAGIAVGAPIFSQLSDVADVASVLSVVQLHAQLALKQTQGLATQRTFRFTFDALGGNYRVGAGLQATAAGAATGAAWAVLLAQVDAIRTIVEEQPYALFVDVQGLTGVYAGWDTIGFPDPYVEVYVLDPDQHQIGGKTTTRLNTLTPTWTTELKTGTVSERLFQLHMKAYDEDKWPGDQLMGTSTVAYDAAQIFNWTNDSSLSTPNFIHRLRAEPTMQNPPVAVAMPDRSAAKAEFVMFEGPAPATFDPDDGIREYRWDFLGNGWGGSASSGWISWNGLGTYHRTVPSLTGEFVARYTVRDFTGRTSCDTVAITIAGDPPTARSSANQPVGTGLPVHFSGIGSVDPDNDIAEYRWTFGAGWSGVADTDWTNWSIITSPGSNRVGNIVVTNEANLARTAPATPGIYEATLHLRDYQGLVDSNTIQVAVIPTTLIVNSVSDSDDLLPTADPSQTNTLRKCIRLANAAAGPNTITFAVSGTIQPATALPIILDDDLTIDAASRWVGTWPDGAPGVVIDGQGASFNAIELNGAERCGFRGLEVTDVGVAIFLDASSHSNIVGGLAEGERNVLENFFCRGDDNLVVGNYVGLDPAGTSGPGGFCTLGAQAERNWIGGNSTNARNVVKGTLQVDGDANFVAGNVVGVDRTGTNWLGGTIFVPGDRNQIGGTAHGEGNVIGGSAGAFAIWLNGSSSNKVFGNLVALDATGRHKLSNPAAGIRVDNGGHHNEIGGVLRGAGNTVASGTDGILIMQPGSDHNIVQGNRVGVDVTGTNVTGMTGYGIYLLSGPTFNTVGGSTGNAANVVGGCARGVVLWQVSSNTVSGNALGTDHAKTVNLGNVEAGVWNESGDSNLIGPDNVIAHNAFGVVIKGGRFNHITQNEIFSNSTQGIDLRVGGNAEIAAPVFGLSAVKLNLLTVSGSGAPVNGTVELFATSPLEAQGHTYLGSVPAGPTGAFGAVMNFPTSLFTHVTAVGVDTNLDTSEFSPAPFQVAPLPNHGVGNGGFGQGLAGWAGWSDDGFGGPAAGMAESAVAPSTLPGTDDMVEVSRIGSGGELGASGIEQVLDLDVRGWASVRLMVDVEVETQTLPGGGAEGEEYPANVRIEYTDEEGSRRNYHHGFYSVGASVNSSNSTFVPPSVWMPFASENLKTLPGAAPAQLDVLRLFGSGHDYVSHFANVELLLEGPLLDIERVSPDLIITWPAAAEGLNLQSTLNLSSNHWSAVTNLPATVGQQRQLARPFTNTTEAFRLGQGGGSSD